jgi:hypothetical protein
LKAETADFGNGDITGKNMNPQNIPAGKKPLNKMPASKKKPTPKGQVLNNGAGKRYVRRAGTGAF